MNAHVRVLVERAAGTPPAATPMLRPRVGHGFDAAGGDEGAAADARESWTAIADADAHDVEPVADPAAAIDLGPLPGPTSRAPGPRPGRSLAPKAASPQPSGPTDAGATHVREETAASDVARERPAARRRTLSGVDRVRVESTRAAEPENVAEPPPAARPRQGNAPVEQVAGRQDAMASGDARATHGRTRQVESTAPADGRAASSPGDRPPTAAAQPEVTSDPRLPARRDPTLRAAGNDAPSARSAQAPVAPPRPASADVDVPSSPSRDRAVDEEAERILLAARSARVEPARDGGPIGQPLVPRDESRAVHERSPDDADRPIEIHIGRVEL
ncbi:MAG: hypothetical protein ACR2LK_05750, partial [Solirubrobacteraceae bacterium]